MKVIPRTLHIHAVLLLALVISCAPVKTQEIWKEPSFSDNLKKTMVIAIVTQETVREQFERVLSNQLAEHGVEAIASYKVLPGPSTGLDRETVVAKVKELGIDNVLVTRSINRKEITNQGGYFMTRDAYFDDWYTYYSSAMIYSDRPQDIEYFTMETKVFDLDRKKAVWAHLSDVKVTGSKQSVVNEFIPVIIKDLHKSLMIK